MCDKLRFHEKIMQDNNCLICSSRKFCVATAIDLLLKTYVVCTCLHSLYDQRSYQRCSTNFSSVTTHQFNQSLSTQEYGA